jgi:hypothetical protein
MVTCCNGIINKVARYDLFLQVPVYMVQQWPQVRKQ